MLYSRVEEYRVVDDETELAQTAGALLDNVDDPKFANSQVITNYLVMYLGLDCGLDRGSLQKCLS